MMVHRFQSNLSLSLWFCTKLAVICHYSVVLIQTLNCTVVVCPGQTAFSVLSFALLCFAFLSFDLFLPFSSGGNLLVTGFNFGYFCFFPGTELCSCLPACLSPFISIPVLTSLCSALSPLSLSCRRHFQSLPQLPPSLSSSLFSTLEPTVVPAKERGIFL